MLLCRIVEYLLFVNNGLGLFEHIAEEDVFVAVPGF